MPSEPTLWERARAAVTAVLLALAVVAASGGLIVATASDAPAAEDRFTVSDATLRWGFNKASNSSLTPDGFHYFSAGAVTISEAPDRMLPESAWSQADGLVSIEKNIAGSGYRPATWEGLGTDANDVALSAASGSNFSDHRVVLAGGVGRVDRTAATAEIAWRGSFTIVYDGGSSFVHVTDPVLSVANGSGTVTATLTGFTAAADDPDGWEQVSSQQVVLTDVSAVDLAAGGATMLPSYDGVEVEAPDGEPTQDRSSAGWGAFPQAFVDFQHRVGQAGIWYSTGTGDAAKRPLPITLGYTAEPTTVREVTSAVLRWGVNNESNNRAFAPGTFNFLSAGKIADPGMGGQTMREADSGATWTNGRPAGWKAAEGNVRIEKYRTDQGYVPATWAGLKTDADGATIASATSRSFSNHEVVLSGGTGSVDSGAGTGEIRWSGSFSLIYYSGMTFFYVSDPVLTIAGGRATVTATLSGFASSISDTSKWVATTPTTVVIADLGLVDLTDDLGFSASPAYLGVTVDLPSDLAPQVRSGAEWGSFPQSFIDYQAVAGNAPFWYSSGGAADPFKVPLPLTVSYDSGEQVVAPTPTRPTTTTPPVTNPIVTPPKATTSPTTSGAGPSVSVPVAVPSVPVVAAPPSDNAVTAIAVAGPVATVLPASAPISSEQAPAWPWWVGTAALLAAAALSLSSTLLGRRS